jgi:transglutaminase-like putative cysteine protease
MSILAVRHRTVYRYARPVEFGEHRLMFRPRDSHDLHLIDSQLLIQPTASVRWLHDVFSNSIAIATFGEPAAELLFESSFRAEHFPATEGAIMLEPFAQRFPFSYSAAEMPDLVRTVERAHADPERRVDAWARQFIEGRRDVDTFELLVEMTKAIKAQFNYTKREEAGTQEPVKTLELGSGSCRDFALLLMEAARSLGFAARFVSGYLYDEKLVDAAGGLVGGGETHAWAQIYLPGAGWVEFDPTNALVGGRNLIRVAVARDPVQAIPLSGTFNGQPDDFLGMEVKVDVTAD